MMKIVLLLALFFFLSIAMIAAQDETCDETTGECHLNQSPQQSPTEVKVAKGSNEQGAPPTAKLGQCEDRYPLCPEYQSLGECEKNPGWMIINCPQSCASCHLLDPKVRCDRNFLNISSETIYAKGEMQQMFANLETEFSSRYHIRYLSYDPYVISFDNFVTDEEITAILNSVEDNWERSTDTGSENEFGETGRIISQSRTSANAWCREACANNELVQNVVRKIEEVTKIPSGHYESMQILRYEVGQFYRTHHDMGP